MPTLALYVLHRQEVASTTSEGGVTPQAYRPPGVGTDRAGGEPSTIPRHGGQGPDGLSGASRDDDGRDVLWRRKGELFDFVDKVAYSQIRV